MKALFELLCLGLKTKTSESVSGEIFSVLNEADWKTIKRISESQGVAAIALDGLDILFNTKGFSICCNISPQWWSDFVKEWYSVVLEIEKRNKRQFDTMNLLATSWLKAGCRVMVMKGQANGLMYPIPFHRNPGDIDCYLFGDYELGNDIARFVGAKVDTSWYKHSELFYNGELFENHKYFVLTREGQSSKFLQKELEQNLKTVEWQKFPNSNILIPPVQWNAMFLTYHSCGHFLSEGLKLKQVLDWAVFLKNYQSDVNWPAFYLFCDRFHLRRFVEAITKISEDYLGVTITSSLITTSDMFSDRILHSILYDNDYVFGKDKGGWFNRWHLLKNLFHYRWKYEDVYQQSVWKKLWWYASGYLFHTE